MTKADYQTLIPAMSAVIEAQGSVSVLFDLAKTDFTTGPRQIDMPGDSWHDIEV